MKKTYLLFTLLCSFIGFSQFNELAPWMQNGITAKNGEPTIDEIVSSFDNYWKTHDRKKRASGYKPFMRWENHWRKQTNEKGYLITPQEMWTAWEQKNQSKLNKNASLALPTSNWLPIGPFTHTNTGSWSNGQGRVNVVCVDPSNANTLYVGSPAGGIWKSTDAGVNWLPLADNLPQIGVSGIAIDYSNPNTIYIATGDKDASDTYSIGVLKSTDGGANWNTTGLTFTDTSTLAGDLVIHPTNNQILWCATTTGIWRTTDGGTNWTNEQSGNFSKGSIRLKPNDPTTVYAVTNNKFYRSTDSGDTFSLVLTGLPLSSGRFILDVTAANANYVYILSSTTGSAFQGIYRSIDGGTNWTKTSGATDIFEGTQAYYDLAFAVSPTNADEVYTGCLNVWKSTNGGATVSKVNNWNAPTAAAYTHADIHFLGFFGNKLFCGSDGGVYVSSNGGTNFASLTAGLQISQFYKVAVSKQSADKMVGGLQDNGGHAYSGGVWKNYYGADGMDTAIDPTNSNEYYGFIQFGGSLFVSSSAGDSSTSSVGAPAAETGTNDDGGNWVTPLATNSVGDLFAGYSRLYKLNGGAWVQQSSGTIGTGDVELISVDPSNDNNMYVSNGAALYKSTNMGVTFTNVYTAPSKILSISVHSSNSSIIYITTDGTGGQALKSTTGGTSFSSISTGLPSIVKNVIRHQGRNSLNPLYVGTALGVYYKDDSMSQWEPFDTNLPNVSVEDLEINLEDSKITAATYGRGIWQSVIPVEVPANDLKLEGIQYPTVQVNCGSFVPQITVKNNGMNPVNTVTVDYQYNGAPLNYVWNGTINPSATSIISLPQISAAKGVYTLSVTATIVNDTYADNNQSSVAVYVNDAGTIGVVNTFETAGEELLTYNDGAVISQWQRGTRVGGAMNSGGNVYTTNLSGNYPDLTKAYLVSQCYNLVNVSNPTISFKMKFDLEQNWDVVYVQYSTDFGLTWNVLGTQGANWYNSNRTQATAGNDCYNCPGAQWTGTDTLYKTYTYPLNALSAESNVIFRIVFHSDDAENKLGVHIDNFVIGGTLATQQFELNNVAIYPNPSKGMFTVSTGTITPEKIEVYDLTGKMVYSKKSFQNNSNEIQLDLSSASSGIYFVKIASENQSVVKRIIKN